jgi:hypothetical protein
MGAHFEMCYMVTKFAKRMLRTMGKSIRIQRLIQEFSYLVKRRKYFIRISAYVT